MTPRVAVFIDYQNVHFSARSRFQPADAPRQHGHVDPGRVAERIVGGRRFSGELTSVRVYRGRPSPDHQPAAARASDRQAAQWERDRRVTVVRRQLRYPKGWPAEPAQEKGIDVALAVDFVRLACENAYDVGILFSRDTDLVPALEAVRDLETGLVHIGQSGVGCVGCPDQVAQYPNIGEPVGAGRGGQVFRCRGQPRRAAALKSNMEEAVLGLSF
ncbi:NYN domain-containing protein [Frankia sp. Cas4]|uniref:NYN domain-containing protein n=1 Tax=Frankia sp. Cas4 TaxID=3073927 RepID=UPI002AD26F73|nr:NYN domain-containing protein [Frankia sp. Cas4]